MRVVVLEQGRPAYMCREGGLHTLVRGRKNETTDGSEYSPLSHQGGEEFSTTEK